MFKPSKRCNYCAHKLVDGECVNKDCVVSQINLKNDEDDDDTKKGDK